MPQNLPPNNQSSKLDLDNLIEECKKYPIGTPLSQKSVSKIYQELSKKKSFSLLENKYEYSEFHFQIFNDLWSDMIAEFTNYRIYIYRTNLTFPFFRDGWHKFYLAITQNHLSLTAKKLADYCGQFEQTINKFREKVTQKIEQKILEEQNQKLQEKLVNNKNEAHKALDLLIERIQNLSVENLRNKIKAQKDLWQIWLDFSQAFPLYDSNFKHNFINWLYFYLDKRYPNYLDENKTFSIDSPVNNTDHENSLTHEVEDKNNKNEYTDDNIITCLEEDPYKVFSHIFFNNQPNINFQTIRIQYLTYEQYFSTTLGVWDEIIKTSKDQYNIDIKKGAISAWWTTNKKFFTPLLRELIGEKEIFTEEIIEKITNDETNQKYKEVSFIKTITSGKGKECYQQIKSKSDIIKQLKSQKFDFSFYQLFLIKQKVGFDIGLWSKIIEELGLQNMSAEDLEIVIRNTIYFYLDQINKLKIPLQKPYVSLKQKKNKENTTITNSM